MHPPRSSPPRLQALATHLKSRPHKRRLKDLAQGGYTPRDAEAAAGTKPMSVLEELRGSAGSSGTASGGDGDRME